MHASSLCPSSSLESAASHGTMIWCKSTTNEADLIITRSIQHRGVVHARGPEEDPELVSSNNRRADQRDRCRSKGAAMAQAIVERACAKLRSAIGDEAMVRLNFTADLRDMLEALEAIQLVLHKAEMQTFSNIVVVEWLQRALDAAYKTMDTVDELQDARSQAAATVTRMLPRLAITKNAETKKLVMSAKQKARELLLKHLPTAENITFQKIVEERKTRPVFEEAMVLGRGSDKESIIAALLSTEPNIMQEHITILPIFGLAVSGKTTLAQMVFNDTHSLQGYDFRVWVHVSPQFDFHTIGNSIICHVSGRGQEDINHSSDMEGMESIMKRLHKLLNGKKVLLVLDDLWEEDPIQLQLLKSMLTFL